MSIASNTTAVDFLLNRALRIYPPYLIALALSTVLLWVSTGGAIPTMNFQLSMLLLPTGDVDSSYAIPYWTLVYEIFFYALLGLLLFLRLTATMRAWFMVAWSFAIVIAAIFTEYSLKSQLQPNALEILVSPLDLYFSAGYVLMYSLSSSDKKPTVALLAILAFFSTIYLVSIRYVFVSGLLACCLVYIAYMVRALPRWMTAPGDWSYGVYLFHLPAMHVLYYFNVSLINSFAATVTIYLVLGSIVGMSFGIFEYWLHQNVMKPMMAKIARRPPTRKTRISSPVAAWAATKASDEN